MRLSIIAAGLWVTLAAFAGGGGRNDRAEVPAVVVPPPAVRPVAGNAPAPVAMRPMN